MPSTDRQAQRASVVTDQLGEEICELAARISAATCRLLRKIAEFDEARGWAYWGCKSCAHWLSWRCGLDLRSAREKVRVAHALGDLPMVSAAFERGEVSYSKVRAITRVATSDSEETLLMWARHGTAAHLEKILRWYGRRKREAESDQAMRQHEDRYLHWDWTMDGSLRIEGKLPPEVGALLLEALQAARDELRTRERAEARDGSAQPRPGAASGSVDGSAEQRPEAEEAEPDPTTAQVQADALALLATSALAGGIRDSRTADRYQVVVHVDASALAGGDGQSHLDPGPALPIETARRLTCDCATVSVLEDGPGNVLDVGRKTRAISAPMRRALRSRDGGCVFPGCTDHRFVDGHHIQHWADGGATSLGNLALLCRFHHVFLHEGGFTMYHLGEGRFAFFRPDGTPIKAKPLRAGGALELGGPFRDIDAETIVPRWGGERCDYSVAVEGLLRLNGYEGRPLRRPPAAPETVPRNRVARAV